MYIFNDQFGFKLEHLHKFTELVHMDLFQMFYKY